MTPHVTPSQSDKHKRSLQIILDNITLFKNELEMKNVYKSYYRFSS